MVDFKAFSISEDWFDAFHAKSVRRYRNTSLYKSYRNFYPAKAGKSKSFFSAAFFRIYLEQWRFGVLEYWNLEAEKIFNIPLNASLRYSPADGGNPILQTGDPLAASEHM